MGPLVVEVNRGKITEQISWGKSMQDTIESFVHKLQTDGVEAGQLAGNEILEKAHAQANKIIDQAKTQASEILREAKLSRQTEAVFQEQELRLAARDAVLQLKQRLCLAVAAVIDKNAESILKNNQILQDLIKDVALIFAKEHVKNPQTPIVFRLAGNDGNQVINQALTQLSSTSLASDGPVFHTETGLSDLGFEYRQGGSAVEVTPQSVVAMLEPLISTEVAKRVEDALKIENDSTFKSSMDNSE